ncbi:hypothetical protein [Variovorax terrae]|uniref:DUF2867 domain-containing protein n=1 Tax=Variovorax terrae TaxID=2923278 RepID=A0A9X2AQ61_9BURK|nr:hypothetical protein [Variovorax terrae]MCJ0764212.1 hypothetical protein [Variovorax terrae]
MALIDSYLPHYQFAERHAIEVPVPPAQVLDAIAPALLASDPLARFFIALRELPARLLARLGGRSRLPKRAFSPADLVALGRDGDREIAFGLAGCFWQADYGLVHLPDAQAFRDRNDQPRLVMNFTASPRGAGCWLETQTRVHCPDAAMLRRFTPYWYLIRPVSGLIRLRLLRRIRQTALARAAR